MIAQTRHFILGAAGHVDHGKTALITALTGTNTDRLKEERERGISIELGFAEFDLGDAPDSTNHHGQPNTAYPATGVLGQFPTVYDVPANQAAGPVTILIPLRQNF